MITYFESVQKTGQPFFVTVEKAIDRIRNGASKKIVEKVRAESDKTKRNEIKKGLPAICFSGKFNKRSDNSILEHSGFVCIDFDGYDDEWDMLNARHKFCNDKYSFAVFTSPSGDGLKVLVKIPKDVKNHKNYFLSLEKYYDCKEFDVTSKNISRVCYESYDPDICVNYESEEWSEILVEEHQTFDTNTSRPTIKLDDNNEVIRRLMIWWDSKFGLIPGQRSNNVFILASAFNEYGVDKVDAVTKLSEFSSESFPISEIRTIIDSAYKDVAKFGTKFYEDDKKIDSINEMVRKGVPKEDIIKLHKDVPTEQIESVVEANSSDNTFWVKNSRGEVRHVNHMYKEYLQNKGYFKYYVEGGSNFVFVKINNNIISDATDDNIKDETLDDLYNMSDLSIYNYFADKTKLFKEDHLSFLDRVEPSIMRDTKHEAYLYYNNCVVKVTADSVETLDYMSVKGLVWDNQKIDRDFKLVDSSDAEYRQFISNVSGGEEERIASIESTIGFLLHSYKPNGFCPAVIINDEVISDNPEGGTGKGMFVSAVGYMKRRVNIDGKTFSFTKSFPYQRVSADTQILVFDDVNKGFEFEKLFSVITEGITLEKKNKDEIYIPFERSPKTIITTNYAIKGVGNSNERRKWELEFSQHYSKNYTPEDEFGHYLFTDWSEDEWNKFDSYMITNLQMYLKHGLRTSKFKNLEERRFIAQTHHDFYEWAKDPQNKYTQAGACFAINEIYHQFGQDNPDFGPRGKYSMPMIKFRHWLYAWGDFAYGQKPVEDRDTSINARCIKFERYVPTQNSLKL